MKDTDEEKGELKPYDIPRIRLDSTSQKAAMDELSRGEELISTDSLLHQLRFTRQQYQALHKTFENFKVSFEKNID